MKKRNSAPVPWDEQRIDPSQDHFDPIELAIAEVFDYDKATMVAMRDAGAVGIPMNKVHALAIKLEIDPGVLLRLVLGWTNPDILDAIERCMGPLNLKPWEVRIIEALRAVTEGRDSAKIVIESGNLRATAVVGNQPASGPS